jgi:hypothetical protein
MEVSSQLHASAAIYPKEKTRGIQFDKFAIICPLGKSYLD